MLGLKVIRYQSLSSTVKEINYLPSPAMSLPHRFPFVVDKPEEIL